MSLRLALAIVVWFVFVLPPWAAKRQRVRHFLATCSSVEWTRYLGKQVRFIGTGHLPKGSPLIPKVLYVLWLAREGKIPMKARVDAGGDPWVYIGGGQGAKVLYCSASSFIGTYVINVFNLPRTVIDVILAAHEARGGTVPHDLPRKVSAQQENEDRTRETLAALGVKVEGGPNAG